MTSLPFSRSWFGRLRLTALALRSLCALAVVSVLPVRLGAAAADAPGQQNRPAADDPATALEVAKVHAKGRNAVAAEEALLKSNRGDVNSVAWHLESAQRLVQLADQLAADAATEVSPDLIRSALRHLDQVDKPSTETGSRVAARLLAGFIQERFLADSRAAQASYEAAVQLAPDSPRAKEAAERRKRADETFRGRKNAGSK